MKGIVAFLALLVTSVRGQKDGIPPSIESGLAKNYIYRDSDQIKLPCVATGEPQPSYEWKRNGAPLPLMENIQWKANATEGSIIIDPATVLDQGYYQCSATNQYGTSLSQVALMQKAVLGSYPPAETIHFPVTEGDSLKLNCLGIPSFPDVSYSWSLVQDQIDQSPVALPTSRRIHVDELGNLYFSHVTPNDQQENKLYKCNVLNAHLDIYTGGSYSDIQVTPNPDIKDVSPALMYSTGTVTALKGESFKIKCIFAGRPEPDIKWEKVDGGHTNWQLENFDTTLVVSDATFENAGVYKCLASNSEGETATVVEVDVQSKPEFQEQIMNTDVPDGSTHSFKCKADAKPAPQTQWFINGEPLDSDNPGKRRSISADRSSLTISKICRNCSDDTTDVMVIQCNVSNAHGYAFADGYLNIVGILKNGGPSSINIQMSVGWYFQLLVATSLSYFIKRVM